MAANAARQPQGASLLSATKRFLTKKLLHVLPLHLAVYAACLVTVLCCAEPLRDKAYTVLNSLPNLLLIQNSGIYTKDLMTSEWYISAMLLMMAVLYPLMLRYRERFTRLFCPIAAILLTGYIVRTTGILGKAEERVLGGLLSKGCLRAFCEMCLGGFCYEAAAVLKRLRLKKAERILLTVTEGLCYTLSLLFTVTRLSQRYEAYVLCLLAIAVTVSFSDAGCCSGAFSGRGVALLGKISFPLYMAQSLAFMLWQHYPAVKALNSSVCAAVLLLITAAFALVLLPVNRGLTERLQTYALRLRSRLIAAGN